MPRKLKFRKILDEFCRIPKTIDHSLCFYIIMMRARWCTIDKLNTNENRARNTLGFLTRFRILGRNDLPEGYTQPYSNTGQPDENVYDRYQTEYEGGETPEREKDNGSCAPKKSCCKIGRLSKF